MDWQPQASLEMRSLEVILVFHCPNDSEGTSVLSADTVKNHIKFGEFVRRTLRTTDKDLDKKLSVTPDERCGSLGKTETLV